MSGELLSRRPIDGVTEREIDLLLLMALHCSPGFRAFLVSKTAGPGDFEFLGAWRGVYDNLGECDLLVLIRDASGQRVAIMVEDKIDASFQPGQASRYRQRGEGAAPSNDGTVSSLAFARPKRTPSQSGRETRGTRS